MATENLLQEFPPVSTQAWEEVIARDLKGADYAKKLIWRSDEGLAVKPYYRAEDLHGLMHLSAADAGVSLVSGVHSSLGWRIREEIDATNIGEANAAARHAIAAGAEEIAFCNVAVENIADLGVLFGNLQEIPVHFEDASETLIRLLIERMAKRCSVARVSTGFDPLTNLDFAAQTIPTVPSALVPFTIHGERFEESGATAVEEVGLTLAAAINFLAAMQTRGVEIGRVATAIGFSFAIGANFFFQMAKFRAFRILWTQALESFRAGHAPASAFVHARTSRWNKTIYDPHVNILRATTEAMSAALGGVDSITVTPFDECYRVPDEASRRLARNTQILLKQEALLSRVADPGAGSYYLEVLTDFIAREGWKCMQTLESAGGFRNAWKDGLIDRMLEQSLKTKEKEIFSRRRIFTGTNRYADAAEEALDKIDPARMAQSRRATAEFEQLRLRTERHSAATGKTPRVLLAEFGDAKMRTARSGFAADFLACAGFDIVAQKFDTAGEIAASDAELIVLCTADAEYLGMIETLMPKLHQLGRTTPVLIAGNPDSTEQLRAAGAADFIHIRSNPIEVLTAWQQRLGIED